MHYSGVESDSVSLHRFRRWEIWFAEISERISNRIFWRIQAERADSRRAEETHHIQRSGLWTGWYTHTHNNNVCERFHSRCHTFVSMRNGFWKTAMSQLLPGLDHFKSVTHPPISSYRCIIHCFLFFSILKKSYNSDHTLESTFYALALF